MPIYNVDETPPPLASPPVVKDVQEEEGSRGTEDGETMLGLFSNSP